MRCAHRAAVASAVAAAELLSQALQTGQLDTSQFGLGGGQAFGVQEFLRAIQRQADEEEAQGSQEEAGAEQQQQQQEGNDKEAQP